MSGENADQAVRPLRRIIRGGGVGGILGGSPLGGSAIRGEPTDLPLAVLLAIGLIGLAAVYTAALGKTRRLEQLSASAEESAFAPELTEVKVSGTDELAAVARYWPSAIRK